MPHVEKHAPGDFSWIELATTDQNAAKTFYSSLFGWEVADMPMGPSEVYTIFRLDGRDAAAGYTMRPEERNHGIPPHWNLYIAAENADAAAARAADLGGKVLMPAFDVMDAGRMAVIQDPAGAAFCIWQAKRNSGIGIAGVDGTLCWADLSTSDRPGAKKFYQDLFGWNIIPGKGKDDSTYLHIAVGEHFIGGILPDSHRNPNAPPHWMPYFQVADADASTGKASKLGARVYAPPMTIEKNLRFSVVADPQGAVFALFQQLP